MEDALGEALGDSNPLVRCEAVIAVVKLKQPGDKIITSLINMSQTDSDQGVRDVATRALLFAAATR